MKLKFQIAVIFWSCMMTISCGVKTNRQIPIESSEVLSNENKKNSIVQVFKENTHLSMEDRIELFYKLKRDSLDRYDFENEGDLNFYGYQLLWNDKDQEAYLIFKMIVSEFPNSSNAYDSFGEICLKMGDKKEALINYKKSLELNPDNFNAEDQIAYILDPTKKPESPSDKFTKIHTVNEYLEDLDQLASKIISTHPNVFKFTSESDFRKLVEEKKKEITQLTTFGEFIWHCDEIIASVNCSHTSISGFYLEHAMLPAALSFPLQTRWVNDRLFIIDPMNNANKVTVKSEITSINGVPTVELIKDIYKHLPSQGHIETTKRHLFNKWSTCFIPYALKFPETFTITLKDSVNPIVLNKANEKTILHKDPSIQHCEKDLCLDFYHNDNTAILTIETFNYYKFQNTYTIFKEFIDSCFVEINSKKSKNLIIDVRQNGGGSPSASIHLLRYLVDKPLIYYSHVDFDGKNGPVEGEEMVMPYEDRYKGKVYFLIDGVGNSTTGHFMSIAKVLNLGTIIGEELGSNQFCSAGGKMLRLSHTKLVYSVADNTHVSMATSLPDETGILPDVYIEQSIDDYLGEIDVVKEYTLNLISKNEE